jgi:predicted Zn-dependent protease
LVLRLEAEIIAATGDRRAAERLYRDALLQHPERKALWYGLADLLLASGDHAGAQKLLEARLRTTPGDAELYVRMARAFDGLGKNASRHRVQAEAYLLRGQQLAAIEQLELAQRAGATDFVEQSMIDARLRELKKRQAELASESRQ